jgi:hypothetical protein
MQLWAPGLYIDDNTAPELVKRGIRPAVLPLPTVSVPGG